MEYNCPNCNLAITANFCSSCGQKKYKRIDKKYLWDEIQYTVLHTNKGFLYSVKSIIKNPGKSARSFIDGNRVNHYKPISLAFVLSGISAFLSFKVVGLNTVLREVYASNKMDSGMMNDYMSFISSYSSIIMLLFIPLFAIFTKLSFRKWGHNYYEHTVMNAFGLSFYTIVSILLLYPVLYFARGNAILCAQISSLSILIVPLAMIWFYKGFYGERPLKSIIWRVLLVLLMVFVCYMVLVFAVVILLVLTKGPGTLKYLQPK